MIKVYSFKQADKLTVLLALVANLYLVAQTTTVNYQASDDDFANPERGFYRYSETRSGSYASLNQSTLAGYRQLHQPPTANYTIYSTLVFRYFFLEDFKQSNISQAYLNNLQEDFNKVRAAGLKIIPRFAYTDDVNGSNCSSWICPPYGDAAKSWILTHISQLAPILENNKDVIAAVQMGFIGVWGENYYTDYFGDASQAPDYKLSDSNWADRIDVLNALLDAVPDERMVQVRYPQQKQRTIYGISALTNASALTVNEAFSGANKARIGFHNDCLLASSDDFGTYTDYGNTASSSGSDTTNLKPYLAEDSKFVVVGGETCSDGYNPQNNCSTTNSMAFGDTELERMHYSYLNAQFNNDVNNDWISGGCIDQIKKRLGYRFELQSGIFSNSAQPNQVIDIDVSLLNTGYTSPYNERGLELILRNTSSSKVWFVALDDDPRYWFAGSSSHNISKTICIPSQIPTGTYELLLHLPDPMPSLHSQPEYSVRLANLLADGSDVWERTTGYNKLGHFIEIDNVSNNAQCNGELVLSELLSPLPVDLIRFQVKTENRNVRLEWTTETEANNEGFYIERSRDYDHFSRVAWIDGAGNSNTPNDYTYTDADIRYDTDYYYRLAQRDYEGTITYSRIVAVNLDSKGSQPIEIYPNPTTGFFNIDYGANNQEGVAYSFDIKSLAGVSVYTGFVSNGGSLDISRLTTGMYFIEIDLNGIKIVKKIVKR